MRNAMMVVGMALIAFGILFFLQGGGVVHWPSGSFMLDQTAWIWRGLGILAVGLLVVFMSRRF
jgi:hypothetical protein